MSRPPTVRHVNPISYIRALPQPLKTLYVLFFLSIVANVVFVLAHVGGERAIIPLGVCAALIGLTLLINLRGGADAVARQMRERKPLGVDYSRSVLASTGYARVFGAFFTLVGSVMTYQGITRP